MAPNRRPYRTKDGYIAALIYNDKHWNAFVNAVQPPWAVGAVRDAGAARHSRSTPSTGWSRETLAERTTAEWLDLFRELWRSPRRR